MPDTDHYVAEFSSFQEAVLWCGFYHLKQEQPNSEGYYRDWYTSPIRYIQDKSAATLRPSDIPAGFTASNNQIICDTTDYVSSDLTWDEIDALPVNDIDATYVCG